MARGKEIDLLRRLLEQSRMAYAESVRESLEVLDLYENIHYTREQIETLRSLQIPAISLNLVKQYTDVLAGYLSTIANDVTVTARQPQYVTQATILGDVISYVLDRNRFEDIAFEIKVDFLLHGYCCVQHYIDTTGELDGFGRKNREIKLHYVPALELSLDPASKKLDYSDASYIHRMRWITRQELIKMFPKKEEKIMKLRAGNPNATSQYIMQTQGNNSTSADDKLKERLCIIHTCYEDKNKRRWSVYWADNEILFKKEITGLKVKFPYIIQKLYYHHEAQFYGVFHDVIEIQRAINILLIQIFQLSMGDKIYVNANSIDEDIAKFEEDVQSVGSIVVMRDINGIRRETHSASIEPMVMLLTQYQEYFRQKLHINDSLLGNAYSADSGRKVQLQQNAGAMALRFLETRLSSFYTSLGKHLAMLITQYFTSNMILPITDYVTGARYVELNKPLQVPTGRVDMRPDGTIEVETEMMFMADIDPETGKPYETEYGMERRVPIPTFETDVSQIDYEVHIRSTPYNNEDEVNQQIAETIIGGLPGQVMAQSSPGALLEATAIMVRNYKTRTSEAYYDLMMRASGMAQQQQAYEQAVAQQQQELQMQQQAQDIANGVPASGGSAVPEMTRAGFDTNNVLKSRKASSQKLGQNGRGQ